MLHTIIEKNSYQDSIVLMLLTNHLEEMEGVNSISVMMGTPANKDIFKTGGLYTEELETATPNDMVIVADLDNADMIEAIVTAAQNYLDEQGKKNKGGATEERVKTWDKALELGEDASINTGIANTQAGKGQIEAGTVTPPIDCFEKAVLAYAKKLGFKD